ncbi:MAG TPA: DNA-protecting protein DprA, partial [Hydrogenophaga sp.]|nr:DNA-protecting protein DprA [Hydrogenophaga sp.]
MNGEELAAWLRLLLTPGVGTDSARKLLAAFGLPEAIFGQAS